VGRRKATRPATDQVNESRADFQAGELEEVRDATSHEPATQGGDHDRLIRATLTGDDCCTAGVVTLTARTPLLALCRVLLANGFDPATPLQAFRGDTLCLMVRSIGMGAALTVAEHDTPRFAPWRPFPSSAVPPRIAPNRRGAP
jgi:hypothetical protein